jgi:putative addiction module component (TIGR02574 family)
MIATVEQFKAQAMLFTESERAELAHFLLISLEPEEDEGVTAAWEAEVGRRVDEIRSGKAVGKAADQLFAELREQYP